MNERFIQSRSTLPPTARSGSRVVGGSRAFKASWLSGGLRLLPHSGGNSTMPADILTDSMTGSFAGQYDFYDLNENSTQWDSGYPPDTRFAYLNLVSSTLGALAWESHRIARIELFGFVGATGLWGPADLYVRHYAPPGIEESASVVEGLFAEVRPLSAAIGPDSGYSIRSRIHTADGTLWQDDDIDYIMLSNIVTLGMGPYTL